MSALEQLSGERLLLLRVFGSPVEAGAIEQELDRRAHRGRLARPSPAASDWPRKVTRRLPRLVA